ncbi:carbohydrate ABC transporter permease [Rubrobacter taiwanensis]|jgi:multiple sugar transport system permease protein|uniref:Carbohydrate ABC transporter permease n=1 Tax=Rubrobacter taiwanensis TaxID=185139 RepID=A0A4R1BQC3_9ACTN|nr:carbohydrate ABC transporter permease [Rubrobacter taiwanensis]TCJ19880.1 carbohydrate ABC transporter permease [Rubrobacter taiwanensis]
MTSEAGVPETTNKSRTYRWDSLLSWLAFGVLLVAAILWLIPLLWAVVTALKPESQTTTVPITWIPEGGISAFTFESFWQVLSAGGLLRWYFNSALTSTVITVAVLLLTSLAGFGLSRVPFRGRTVVFWLIIAGLIVPPQILIIPLFMEMDALGFVDTYQGIILPQIASPLGVFIFKQFFDGIPHELEEAAIVDGASRFRIYWQIWMPLARPVIAAVGIFTFVLSWNNFIWPFVVVTNTDMMTIPVGLATVQSSYGLRYADIMASAVLGGLPLLVVFLFFQRQIVQGIASTGLKG